MLSTSDKVSIINALMQEDRNEIRLNKNILLSSTYFVLSGIIAIAGFTLGVSNPRVELALMLGWWSLFGLYFIYFAYFMHHLKELRIYLDVRERYLKDPELLEAEDGFAPFEVPDRDATPSLVHPFYWFLPFITFLVSIGNTLLVVIP
jgi:hypothetical protein